MSPRGQASQWGVETDSCSAPHPAPAPTEGAVAGPPGHLRTHPVLPHLPPSLPAPLGPLLTSENSPTASTAPEPISPDSQWESSLAWSSTIKKYTDILKLLTSQLQLILTTCPRTPTVITPRDSRTSCHTLS